MELFRRAWIHPDGPTGRPIGRVNPIDEPKTGREVSKLELPLPAGTLAGFLDFLLNHRLANGEVATIPALSSPDFAKLLMPYNDWAPAPYNNNPIPSDSAMNRFSLRFTPMPDMEALFSGGDFSLPTEIDFELETCLQRLWAGMVPFSDRRWAEKKLDSPENIDVAVEHLLTTCDMVYFSLPENSRRMRHAYNKAYDGFKHFDTVLDAYYASTPNTPRPSPIPRVADLWADFFFSHVKFITNRIHTWAASRVDRITDALHQRLHTAPTLPGAARPSPEQDALFKQFQRLTHTIRRLDETILLPLVGFKNTLPRWRHATSPPVVNWPAYIRGHGATPLAGNYPADIQQRDEAYYQRVARLVREESTRAGADGAGRGGAGPFSAERFAAPCQGVRAAYALGRRDLRGEPQPVGEELPPRFRSWGFVAYRLWYGHSEEEWATFLRKFEANVGNWGAGVAGAEAVKGKMEIRWVDGRDYGIAEGDVEGARKHFKRLHENEEAGLRGLNAPAFLVADRSSIDSHIHERVLPGQTLVDEADMGPFILVGRKEVDRPDRETRGFDGTVRVLGSVLLDDVWACLSLRNVDVEDMWNLATWHPSGVYVGPVVRSQVDGWDQFRGVRDSLLTKAHEWQRQGRLN
ncbi:hypothetical protein B0I37DRAFT_382030 [Chaetomium sp. MPI-CAGE-AT-0009]|nr:hypothetical protein B0I37DRAFT_382030 [Chaetomium sp. MPI-CAGE-AT-0009]